MSNSTSSSSSSSSKSTLSYGTMNFIAGTSGGFASVFVGQPFDIIKVRLQCQSSVSSSIYYRNSIHCMNEIIRHESILGLFKGMSSPLWGVTIINACLFSVYGTLLQYQLHPDHHNCISPSLYQIYIAGFGSGIINSFISCPMELIKIKLQIQTDATHSLIKNTRLPHFYSPLHCLKYLISNYGLWRGAYLGIIPTIIRETPSYGTYFCTYEAMCRYFVKSKLNNDESIDLSVPMETILSPMHMMIAGGTSGVMAWCITYPFDVIKTKIQSADHGTYKGMIDCFRQTIKADGMAGLWRGVMATIIRAFPTNAATFVVWHHTVELLKQH